jgi:hypothetical protein
MYLLFMARISTLKSLQISQYRIQSSIVHIKISLVPIRLYPICPIKGLDTDFPFSDTPQPHHIKPNPIAKFEY